MIDKITFMETLHSVQEIIQTNAEPITKEVIQEYFKEMDLSKEQQEMIYQYLLKSQEEPVVDILELGGEEDDEISTSSGKFSYDSSSISQKIPSGISQDNHTTVSQFEHSKHFQRYLREIKEIPILSEEQKFVLYKRLLLGEREVMEEISRQWLGKIIEIAKTYVSDKLLLEDLVQEGNIGLLLGIEQILGNSNNSNIKFDISDLESKLEIYIKESIEDYQKEIEGMDSGEYTILAKVNLIYAAQKALAEQSGTIPTLQELSKYTKIPIGEVEDILALPKETS
ncbi:MAG: hypothetical protein K1V96_11065 [Lachnospiraceae bacterium]